MYSIRRIKCDEVKPSCNKCSSTGRVCDGYALAIRAVDGARESSVSRRSQLIERSISDGISGTETERNFFYICRRATSAGVALHICSTTSFWTQLATQLSHQYEAVRHAVVAVGAAYHLYKVADVTSVPRSTKQQIESFVLEQYNRSLYQLHKDIGRQCFGQDSTIVLTCCLAYIYLESLRLDHAAAMKHLNNGIRIIEATVDLDRLASGQMSVARKRQTTRCKTALTDSDLWETVLEFRNCELCMHCFSSEVPMRLGSKLCQTTLPFRAITTHATGFHSISEAHEARVQIGSQIMSYDWQWQSHKFEPSFWAQNHVQETLAWLHREVKSITLRVENYMLSTISSSGDTTWEWYSLNMDMLHLTCLSAVIALMQTGPEHHDTVTCSDDFQQKFVSKMIAYGEQMHSVYTSLKWPPPDISLETSIIGPMYWAYVYSTEMQAKKRALKVLQETSHREGPWDAKQILLKLATADLMSQQHDDGTQPHPTENNQLRKWGAANSNCYE